MRRTLASLPEVERTAGADTLVVALLDRSVSNGSGRLGLLESSTTPNVSDDRGRPFVVEGRVVDPTAANEIMVGEAAARVAGVHADDKVQMAGWKQGHLDAAIDGSVAPETRPFPAQIVGVVRFIDDVQPTGDSSLSDDRIGLNPMTITPRAATPLASFGALAIATPVALFASRGSVRTRASQQLRVE